MAALVNSPPTCCGSRDLHGAKLFLLANVPSVVSWSASTLLQDLCFGMVIVFGNPDCERDVVLLGQM